MSCHAAGSQFCHESLATQCGNVTGTNPASPDFAAPVEEFSFPPNSQSRPNVSTRLATSASPGRLAAAEMSAQRNTGVNARAEQPIAQLRTKSLRDRRQRAGERLRDLSRVPGFMVGSINNSKNEPSPESAAEPA